MSVMPKQKPGKSVQTYGTPWELIHAVQDRLGIEFEWDLAASKNNAKAPKFITKEENSLNKPWRKLLDGGWGWLNPPFAHISPWVAKAQEEGRRGAHIAMLLPASVGSEWFANYVEHSAAVEPLRPRVTFVGETHPYPKDLMLLFWRPNQRRGSFQTWRWK